MGDDAAPSNANDRRATPTTSASTPSHQTTTALDPADETPAQRCTGERGPGRAVVIRHGRSQLTAAQLGRGPTWAVLLHQTNGDGYCGWWRYARWLADHDVHVFMVDLCGFGSSSCHGSYYQDQPAQAVAAVRQARRHGAERVVLVGASMGGAVAAAAAGPARVDAVVDLSGPPEWTRRVNLVSDSRSLTMPTLFAVSTEDASYVRYSGAPSSRCRLGPDGWTSRRAATVTCCSATRATGTRSRETCCVGSRARTDNQRRGSVIGFAARSRVPG